MDKKEALKIMLDCAKLYHDSLENKNLLIVSYDNRYNFIETKFTKSNYLHLTGVYTKINPNAFYNKCLQGRLSLEDFLFKNDGTTVLKLSIFPQLMNIHKNANILGKYNYSKPKLVTDKLAGNIRGCIGFDRCGKYYIPKTALKEDIRDLIDEPERIIAIFSKDIKMELYDKLLYSVRDGIDVNIPLGIIDKIDIDNFTYDFKKINEPQIPFEILLKNRDA